MSRRRIAAAYFVGVTFGVIIGATPGWGFRLAEIALSAVALAVLLPIRAEGVSPR